MRNTYDNKHPFSKSQPGDLQESKDLDSYSVQGKMSYQKQPPNTNVSNNEKMTKYILQALKKISIQKQKFLSMSTLKATQKTLLSTIAAFLHSFDNQFQQANLTIEILPDLFKSIGYPGQVNKTYFQPVGAPHTWCQCLAMMEWIGDLASFHIDMRRSLEDGEFDQDLTSLLIRGYLEENPDIPRGHLERQIERKVQIIENLKYSMNTLNLEIENQKSAQKDLNVLEQQRKRSEAIQNRQNQELIQVIQQTSQMERKKKELQLAVEDERRINEMKNTEIALLTKQIQNQELSVEEVERIRFQIRQYHEKNTELRKFYQREKQTLDNVDTNIINEFMDFNKTLEGLRHLHRMHKYEMDKRNVYMQIPECDVNTFTQFLKNRNEDCSSLKVQQVIGTKQVKEIYEKADLLLSLMDVQLKELDNLKQQVNNENKVLAEECIDKEIRNSELEMNLNLTKTKNQGIQVQIQDNQAKNKHFTSQIAIIEEQKNELQKQHEKIFSQGLKALQLAKQMNQIKFQLEEYGKEMIKRMETHFQSTKIQSLEMIEVDYIEIEQLLEDMGGYEDQDEEQQQDENCSDSWQDLCENEDIEKNPSFQAQNANNCSQVQQYDKQVEIPRQNNEKNADDEFDYNMIFGKGSYQSPKPEQTNRMKQYRFQS